MDAVYNYILEYYKAGEPIFLSDIKMSEVSDETIRQQLKRLADAGKLMRYEAGIYYLPKKTRLKSGYKPSADVVARYKYICRNGEVIGYYSGHTFANQIGVSTQVPFKAEIVSNNFTSIVRDVKVGNQIYTVRRSRVPVTGKNYKVLQLLELLKDIDEYADEDNENVQEQLFAYIRKNRISREQVDQYLEYFPMKIYKSIYEIRLEHVFA